jgi:hypothetical protein
LCCTYTSFIFLLHISSTPSSQELDLEFSRAIETREANILSRRQKHSHDVDAVDDVLGRYKARADELLQRTAAETSQFSDFMSRLKATAATHKQQILTDRGETSTATEIV